MPENIKIYHIIHIDTLPYVIADGSLFSDSTMRTRPQCGAIIGMNKIKERRLTLSLTSHQGLHVGECVPFYFCPRSVMLYMFHMRNHSEIDYQGGQEPILHLVADLQRTVVWAEKNSLRWAFTSSNAGSYYFEDYADLKYLNQLDWDAIQANQWSGFQDKKQAEFLIEGRFPWEMVEGIGVYSSEWVNRANDIAINEKHKPQIKAIREWYY